MCLNIHHVNLYLTDKIALWWLLKDLVQVKKKNQGSGTIHHLAVHLSRLVPDDDNGLALAKVLDIGERLSPATPPFSVYTEHPGGSEEAQESSVLSCPTSSKLWRPAEDVL